MRSQRRQRERGRWPAVALAAIILVLPACGRNGEPAREGEPKTITVNLLPYITYGPLLIADEEGFFSEQGLRVEFVPLRQSMDGMAALSTGELDVLGGYMNAGFLNAIARGAGFKLVADRGYVRPGGCAMTALVATPKVAEQRPWEQPGPRRPLKMAVEPQGAIEYMDDLAFARLGLEWDDVEPAIVPVPARLHALGTEEVDLADVMEPWLSMVRTSGVGDVLVDDYQIAPGFQYSWTAFGPSLLEEDPDAGERFMVAYLKGARRYMEGATERNLDVLSRRTVLSREDLQRMCWTAVREDGRINAQSVLDFQAWALDKGYLDRALTVEEFWEPRFVDHANRALGAD